MSYPDFVAAGYKAWLQPPEPSADFTAAFPCVSCDLEDDMDCVMWVRGMVEAHCLTCGHVNEFELDDPDDDY